MAMGSTHDDAVADREPSWHGLFRALIEDDGPLGDALRRTGHSAAELIGCRCAVLTVLDPTGALEHFVVACPDGSAVDRVARLPVRDGPLAPVVESGRPVRLVGTEPALEPAQLTAVLGVPVELDGAIVGGLYLCDPLARAAFDDDDEHVAVLLAKLAAAVIRRAWLGHAAEQRQRWLVESAALTRALLSGDDINPLRLVVERVRDMADADLVAVIAERSDSRTYEVIDAAGPHAAALLGRTVSAAATLVPRVIAEGAPLVLSELGSGSLAELNELSGAEAAILAPFSGGGVEHGLLAIYRRPERPVFSTAEIDAATMFAAQLTLALELADSRAKRERGVLLDERGRIARDLHDHVIQRLFAIGLTMQSVAAQSDPRVTSRLQDCLDGIDEAITQIRSTIYRLTGPLVSAENSLRTRAARLVEDVAPVLGFRAELDVRGPVDFGVDDDVTDDSIAVLREALTNVAKHAQASRVVVTISVSTSELSLEVSDDGRGIGAVSRRSGLANLRARAERRRGRLIVASGQPRGTRLTWTVPIGTTTGAVRSVG